MSRTMSRQAQRMLADLGFEKIENDELTIGPVKLLLSRRGIDLLNCQANELEGQFPIRGRAGPARLELPSQLWLAQWFHDTYERLAPEYGYVTRNETRVFDPFSPNGKLMIAVCKQLREALDVSHATTLLVEPRK